MIVLRCVWPRCVFGIKFSLLKNQCTMDLTVDLPDSRGNFRFVWPLHEPVALINTRPPIYTRHLWKIILFLTWRQNADHFSKLVYGTEKSKIKGSTITIQAQVLGHYPKSFCTPPRPPPYSNGHCRALFASILSATIDHWGRVEPPPMPKCLPRELMVLP